MVTWQRIVGTVIIIGVAILLTRHLLTPESHRVRKRFDVLAACLSKTPDEKTSGWLLKGQSLQHLFADSCTFELHTHPLHREMTPTEIGQEVMRARAVVQALDVTFHDLDITFPEPDRAVVTLTVRATVTHQSRDRHNAEVVCVLEKTTGKWLFRSFEEIVVLER